MMAGEIDRQKKIVEKKNKDIADLKDQINKLQI